MELQAKVIQILPIQSGTSKAGKPWQSQDVITETLGNYPKKVKLKFFGDKAIEIAARLIPGQIYDFAIDIDSREVSGRWYTDVTCYKAKEGVGQTAQPQAYPTQPQTYTPQSPYGQQTTTPPGAAYQQSQALYAGQPYPQQQAYQQPLFPPEQTDKNDGLPF